MIINKSGVVTIRIAVRFLLWVVQRKGKTDQFKRKRFCAAVTKVMKKDDVEVVMKMVM
jgi:hypothetical protein